MLLIIHYSSFFIAVFAWGPKGHRQVTEAAIEDLPREMKGFYRENQSYLTAHCLDPDKFRSKDPEEGKRHSFDMDAYKGSPFSKTPIDYEEAVKRFGPQTVDANGVLPWHIQRVFLQLTEAFRTSNWSAILDLSAQLGHYVADSRQPLHSTRNFDGQLTGNAGLHARYEMTMYQFVHNRMRVTISSAHYVKDPLKSAFGYLEASNKQLGLLLAADAKAKKESHGNEREYYTLLWDRVGDMTDRQLSLAASDAASLWYSAWRNAGKPRM